jgi:hypothetical protein
MESSSPAPQQPGMASVQLPGLPTPIPIALIDPEALARTFRGHSVETTASAAATEKIRIRPDEIGTFDIQAYDPEGEGIVGESGKPVYTDIHAFLDALSTLREDPETKASTDKQIIRHFHSLLGGPARFWWTNQITSTQRINLRCEGLDAILNALLDRFPPNVAQCTRRFNNCTITLAEIANDENALERHFQKKLRYARGADILMEGNTNWYGVVHNIFEALPTAIRQLLRPPDRSMTLDQYMYRLAEGRTVCRDTARDFVNPVRILKQSLQGSDFRRNDRKVDRKERFVDHSRNRNRDQECYAPRPENKSGTFHKPKADTYRNDKYREKDRDAERDQANRDRAYERDKYRQNERNRDQRDRAHIADKGGDADDSAKTSETDSSDNSFGANSEAEIACLIIDRHLTCHKCHQQFNSQALKKAHSRQCSPLKAVQLESIRTPSPNDPSRRTCGYCRTVMPSRNALFRHLKTCEDAIKGLIRAPPEALTPVKPISAKENQTDSSTAVDVDHADSTTYKVREAPTEAIEKADDSLLSSFTYLRIKARANPDGEDVEICVDPGTGRSIIDRKFLMTLKHSIEKRKGRVRGISKRSTKLSGWATFEIYLPGYNDKSQLTLMKFTKSAWVVDDLQPNLLLANDFTTPYNANIDYETTTLSFKGLDFTVDFNVQTRSLPCVRKVTTTRKITLLPGQKAYVPVSYKPLPPDRSFAFEAKHAAAMHAVVDAKTPRVAVFVNNTSGTLTIPKHCHAGHIKDNTESGYFASSWNHAMKAITIASAMTAGFSLAAAQPVTTSANGNTTPGTYFANSNLAPTVATKFNLTPAIQAIAEGYSPAPAKKVLRAPTSQPAATPTETPLTDTVFNLIQASRDPFASIRTTDAIYDANHTPLKTAP